MVIKKKYHGGLKLLLFLLFIMLLGMFSTCYANNYTDFEIPIEWFENLINYINQNSSANDYISSFSLNATSLKSCYDSQVKASLKTLVESVGGDERNTVCFIKYPTSLSDSYMYLYFIISNNTLNNVANQYKVQPSSTYFDVFKDDSSITANVKSIRISKTGSYQLYNASSVDYATLGWKKSHVTYNGDTTTIENGPFFGLNGKPLNIVHYYINGQYQYLFINGYYNIQPTATPIPTPIPTPVPTPTSAPGGIDYTGQLTEIKDTISGEGKAIRDTISGETDKVISALTGVPSLSGDYISSGDITSQIDFSLLEENQELSRYSNFWYNFINGLRSALTSNVRSINIEFRGQIYTINLDDFTLQLPSDLKFILEKISIVFFVWLIIKWWKIIIDKISSGNIEEVLAMNEEEGIVDLF